MIPIALLKYWKWVVLGVLLIALGAQTWRLDRVQMTVVKMKLEAKQLELDIATARIDGIAEGERQMLEAQRVVDATRKQIHDQKIAAVKRRANEATARAERLEQLLSAAEWGALYKPLPENVLDEFRQ
jgi:hypothetical protein